MLLYMYLPMCAPSVKEPVQTHGSTVWLIFSPCGDSLGAGEVSTDTMTPCVLSAHAAADLRLTIWSDRTHVRRPEKERHKGKPRHVQQVESDACSKEKEKKRLQCLLLPLDTLLEITH